MNGPVLTTTRLWLRPFEPADARALERLVGEYEVALNTASIPHPYPAGAAEAWIAMQQEMVAKGTSANFAIVEPASGRLVGAIGLTIERAHRSAELGYWIEKASWGQGLATEAARAVVDYGFAEQQLNRIWAGHFARNRSSGRVMEKVGMRLEGVLREHFIKWNEPQDVCRYAILRREWEAAARVGGSAAAK